MTGYSKIVIAVDLSNESGLIIRRAIEVAGPDAEVHIVYVQEPLETVYLGVVPYGPVFTGMDQVEDRLKGELREKQVSLGRQFGVPEQNTHILNGSPAREIHRFADESGVDLIVLGTHGHKGVQLLLGSTANAVLHGANCDVLAVRITDS